LLIVLVLVWSLQDTLPRAEFQFTCQSPVLSASFSPFSPTTIIGATYSGHIVIWDTRARQTPVQQSHLSSVTHTHPVYSLTIIGTKNAPQIVTASTDGKICVWTPENLLRPLEVIELRNVPLANFPVAPTAIGFSQNEMNKFFIGSEDGAVYKAKRFGNEIGVIERSPGHSSSITSLDFHPADGPVDFSQLFLTSSTDWTCRLWNQQASLCTFENSTDCIYDVKWCPTHPALFSSVDGSGNISIWNLNESVENPSFKSNLSKNALNSIEWSRDGKKVIAGDSAGCLFLCDVGQMGTARTDEWKILESSIRNFNLQDLSDSDEDRKY